MRRVFSFCVAMTGLILMMSLAGQTGLAADNPKQAGGANGPAFLNGQYVFTLTEKCVHQLSANTPGFDSSFHLVDPAGAETYSGASDGFMVFDGNGGASIVSGRATNIMNRESTFGTPTNPSRLIQPVAPPIPLGFGLGSALPFSCTGNYTIVSSKITVNLTCNATLTLPNVFNATGFQSTFHMEGALPRSQSFPPRQFLLTDIGDTVQPVTIFFATNPVTTAMQQRICTRSTNLVLYSTGDDN